MNILWHKTLQLLKRVFDTEQTQQKSLPDLSELVEQARQEWLKAQAIYDTVLDDDLIDYATYLVQSTEKRYIYLLKQARQQGITDHYKYLRSG